MGDKVTLNPAGFGPIALVTERPLPGMEDLSKPLGGIAQLLAERPLPPLSPDDIRRGPAGPILAKLDQAPADYGIWLKDQVTALRTQLTPPPEASDDQIYLAQHRIFRVFRESIAHALTLYADRPDEQARALDAIGTTVVELLLGDPQIRERWERSRLEPVYSGPLGHLTAAQREAWLSSRPTLGDMIVGRGPPDPFYAGLSEAAIRPGSTRTGSEAHQDFAVITDLLSRGRSA
jgi:hypothetical protein